MVRLTRAERRQQTRAQLLSAAREEFTAVGYDRASVDRIAARAELTRGAVYSNFPSKRALYLAVLQQQVEDDDPDDDPADDLATAPNDPADALAAFARVWLERFPLLEDPPPGARIKLQSLSGVLDDVRLRPAMAQVVRLEALLLGLALESVGGRQTSGGSRQVRRAELTLTLLHGAGRLAEEAPGFGDPFDLVRACAQLADLDLGDHWDPPHLDHVASASPCDQRWDPPRSIIDGSLDPTADGVITVLGIDRLGAAEEAVRAAGDGDLVTIVVLSDTDEVGRIVRLRVSDMVRCLRRSVGVAALRRIRIVVDTGPIAASLGIGDPDRRAEIAVRLRAGRIVARAEGPGAGHVAGRFARTDADTGRNAGAIR